MPKQPLESGKSLRACNETVSKKNDGTTFVPGDGVVDRTDLVPVLYGSMFLPLSNKTFAQFLIIS